MAKIVNYTAEQTKGLVEAYTAADTAEARAAVVVAWANKLEKKVQSIRAKLSREGVYVKEVRTTKAGEKVETKEAIVAEIAEAFGEAAEVFESLTKANKGVLQKIRDRFAEE